MLENNYIRDIIINQYNLKSNFNLRKTIEENQNNNYCNTNHNALYCRNRVAFYILFIIMIIIIILAFIFFILSCIRKRKRRRSERNIIRVRTYLTTNRVDNEIIHKKKISYLLTKILSPTFYSKENIYLNNICIFCLEQYKEGSEIIVSPCKHCFHFSCIKNYMLITENTFCPLCKFDFFKLIKKKKINFDNIQILKVENENEINPASINFEHHQNLESNVISIRRSEQS